MCRNSRGSRTRSNGPKSPNSRRKNNDLWNRRIPPPGHNQLGAYRQRAARAETVSAEEIARHALALCEELLEWAEFLGLNTAEYRDEYTRLATAYMAKTGLKIS